MYAIRSYYEGVIPIIPKELHQRPLPGHLPVDRVVGHWLLGHRRNIECGDPGAVKLPAANSPATADGRLAGDDLPLPDALDQPAKFLSLSLTV